MQAILAWTVGDTALQADILRRIGDFPPYYRFYAVHGVARFARNAAGAQEFLRGYEGSEPWVVIQTPNLLITQGKLDGLRRFMAIDPRGANAQLGYVRGVPLDLRHRARRHAADARSCSQRFVPPIRRKSRAPAGCRPTTTSRPSLAAFERNYHTALLMVHLDRPDEARRIIALMNRADSFPGLGQTKQEAINIAGGGAGVPER